MSKRTLSIPARHRKLLATILSYDEKHFNAIVSVLKDASIGVLPEDLGEFLNDRLAKDVDQARALGPMLSSLVAAWPDGKAPEEFVGDIIESCQLHPDEFAHVDWDRARQRLAVLVPLEVLLVAGRSNAVLGDYERTFCSARILTDIRSVFGRKVEDRPVGASVVHLLRISYHQDSNQNPQDFYVALDAADVRSLQDALQRATLKEESINGLLKSTGIAVISSSGGHQHG